MRQPLLGTDLAVAHRRQGGSADLARDQFANLLGASRGGHHRASHTIAIPAILSFWKLATDVASSTDDIDGLDQLWRHDPDSIIVATDDGDDIIGTLIAAWDGWRGRLLPIGRAPGPSPRWA